MKDAITVKGKRWRVQIKVFDFKYEHTVAAGPNLGHVYFSVSRLPSTAHRSTAFNRGQGNTLYHGEDYFKALQIARETADVEHTTLYSHIPNKWSRYENI